MKIMLWVFHFCFMSENCYILSAASSFPIVLTPDYLCHYLRICVCHNRPCHRIVVLLSVFHLNSKHEGLQLQACRSQVTSHCPVTERNVSAYK
jgi:hypothetical protein